MAEATGYGLWEYIEGWNILEEVAIIWRQKWHDAFQMRLHKTQPGKAPDGPYTTPSLPFTAGVALSLPSGFRGLSDPCGPWLSKVLISRAFYVSVAASDHVWHVCGAEAHYQYLCLLSSVPVQTLTHGGDSPTSQKVVSQQKTEPWQYCPC